MTRWRDAVPRWRGLFPDRPSEEGRTVLALLPYAAVVLGLVAVFFGLEGVAKQELSWTRRRLLRGRAARLVGAGCVLAGLALIADTVLMLLLFPEGLGH